MSIRGGDKAGQVNCLWGGSGRPGVPPFGKRRPGDCILTIGGGVWWASVGYTGVLYLPQRPCARQITDDTVHGAVRIGNETKPDSYSVNYIIKY